MSSGTRVSAGRLRVDAARAVDKLRTYQLTDPIAWVLEVVRAASAFGATAIRVTGDADDLRVAWNGPGPDAEALERLFDELVDPAPRPDRRPLRLLAIGVNTALGLPIRFVDVTVTDGSAAARFVRYSPGLLKVQDGAAGGLRSLRTELREAPKEAPSRGVLVHLKRYPSFGATMIALGLGEPRELTLVRESCDDSHVPLMVGTTKMGADRSHSDLLRIRLGGGFDGFLALLDSAALRHHGEMHLAEHGAILARNALRLPDPFGNAAQYPLRLYFNAPRLPTNASRSVVRLADPPVRGALERAGTRLPILVTRLARELSEDAEHDWSPGQRVRLRAAALRLIAAAASGGRRHERLGQRGWSIGELPESFSPLLETVLLRDALGRPRTASSFAGCEADVVHVAPEPAPAELEPWLGDVLWVPPGDPARALLGDSALKTTEDLIRQIQRDRESRLRFAQLGRREAALAVREGQLLIVPIAAPGPSLESCAPRRLFDLPGLSGELALLDPDRQSDGLTVLLGGRKICTWWPDRAGYHTPVEAVLTCEGLVPATDLSRLSDTARATALRLAGRAAHVAAAEQLAGLLAGVSPSLTSARYIAPWLAAAVRSKDTKRLTDVRAVVRDAVLRALELLADLQGDVDAQTGRELALRELVSSDSPLVAAQVWPTLSGERFDLRALLEVARERPHVLGYSCSERSREDVGARPLFRLTSRERGTLKRFLPETRFIDYEPALRCAPTKTLEERAQDFVPERGAGLLMRLKHGLTAMIAWGDSASTLEVVHVGVRLTRRPLNIGAPHCTVWVDDPQAVPGPSFASLRSSPSYPVARWEERLARAFVDKLTGQGDHPDNPVAAAHRFLGGPALEAHLAIEAFFVWLAGHPGPAGAALLGKRRWSRLREVPFVQRLGRTERCTLSELAADFPESPIQWVDPLELGTLELGSWSPVQASAPARAGYARLLGCEFESGAKRLAELRRANRRALALARHRARPAEDPSRLWSGLKVEVQGDEDHRAVATFLSASEGPAVADVTVLIEGRVFGKFAIPGTLPLRLMVDLSQSAADPHFLELSEDGRRATGLMIRAAARELLSVTAERRPKTLLQSPSVFALLSEWSERLSDGDPRDEALRDALLACPAFPTVQGSYVALSEAIDRGAARVARWQGQWLRPSDPAEGPDRPVLRLPADAERHRRVVVALAGSVRDVSQSVARLQAERRVEQGLEEAPRLPDGTGRSFCVSLSELAEGVRSAKERHAFDFFGPGEAALVDDPWTRVHFRGPDGEQRSVELRLLPSVHIAAQIPRQRSEKGVDLRRLRRSAASVVDLLVRRFIEDDPDAELPKWLRRGLLRAALTRGASPDAGSSITPKALEAQAKLLERWADLPLFETTAGSFITLREVRAQAERYGVVWTVQPACSLIPLEPARVALRLSSDHSERLSPHVQVYGALSELRLDARARENLARPPVSSLEMSEQDREVCSLLAVSLAPEPGHSSHGSVVLLKPGFEGLSGIQISRSFQPLGKVPDVGPWPVAARIDDPELTPDRIWSEAVDDPARRALVRRVSERTRDACSELVPAPGGKLLTARVRSARGLPLEGRGSLFGMTWLEMEPGPGVVQVVEPGVEREVPAVSEWGAPLDLHGMIYCTEQLSERALRQVLAALHLRLLTRLAEVLAAHRGRHRRAGLARLFNALASGFELEDEVLDRIGIEVPGLPSALVRSAGDLRRHLAVFGRVNVCTEEQVQVALEAMLPDPLFIDDGSAASEAVLRWIGPRATMFTEALRLRALAEQVAEQPAGQVAAARAGEPEPSSSNTVAEPPVFEPPMFEPPPPAATPPEVVDPLALAVKERWDQLPLPPVLGVTMLAGRERPSLSWRPGHLTLSGQHPAILRARAAILAGSDSADAHVALVIVRAVARLEEGAAIEAHVPALIGQLLDRSPTGS